MGCGRAILCIVFPPLAVLDRGCGTVVIVFALTLAGWVPGAIAALLLNYTAHVLLFELGLHPILSLLHTNTAFGLADGFFGHLMEQREMVPCNGFASLNDHLICRREDNVGLHYTAHALL